MGSFSLMHWVIVLLVVMLLFGGGRISGLMGDVAKGIKSFKKGMSDEDAEKAETAQERRTLDHNEADVVRHDVATKKTVN